MRGQSGERLKPGSGFDLRTVRKTTRKRAQKPHKDAKNSSKNAPISTPDRSFMGFATTLYHAPRPRPLEWKMRRGFSPIGGRLRFLVAGAAGFIGSHLCDRLLAEGHDVLGVDSFLTGSRANLAQLAGNPRFRLIEHDITTPAAFDEPVETVMNLASPASPRDYLAYPVETLRAGSEGTRQLLDYAVRFGASFLLASTSECYGDPLEHPQRESYWGNVNPVGPRSCYDEAKRYAEALTMAYHRACGVQTSIARIFNTYGPRMKAGDGRIVPAFIGQALRGQPMTVYGTGSQTRSFCYVSDLVDGLLRLAFSGEPYPVNLGNPEELTVLEFATRIRDITASGSEIVFESLPEDDPQRRKPDISKAISVLGWQPRVSLDAGLGETIAWFCDHLTPPEDPFSGA